MVIDEGEDDGESVEQFVFIDDSASTQALLQLAHLLDHAICPFRNGESVSVQGAREGLAERLRVSVHATLCD